MPCAMSVIVRIERSGGWLTRLIASLDAQTLPAAAFEVVLELDGPGTAVAQRLEELAGRRPNVRVTAAGGAGDLAAGEWLLDLGHHLNRLKPELPHDALERLVAFGAEHHLDVVLGRIAERTAGLTPDLFTDDRPEYSGSAAPEAPGVASARRRAPADAPRTGVLGGSPVLLVDALHAPEDATTVRVSTSAAQWSEGRLVVSAEGKLSNPPAEARVIFSVLSRTDGSEYWLPTRSQEIAEGRFSASAEFDVRSAASGEPLPDGSWQIRVGAHGPASGWARRVAVPPTSVAPGIVDGLLVVPVSAEGALTVDVGARRASPVGRVDVADVSIVDSARGTELTASLPAVAVAGESRTPGFVVLDSLKVPGVLIAEAGRARLQAYVSGLAGTVPLKTQFGAGGATPTGLSLKITPIGTMSVVPTPKPAAKAPAAGRSARAVPARHRPPVLTRLRRKVPNRMEPAVAALSHNETARRVYRRLIGR
jgi:hypothetical protein